MSRPRHRRPLSKEKAFTLLEVLAAVAILAVAVLSLYSLQNKSIDLSSYVNEMTIATMMVREKASEAELKIRFPNFMLPKKSLQEEYPGFELEDLTGGDTGITSELPEGIKPKTAGIMVKWKHMGKDEAVTLKGFVPSQ